MNEHKEQAAALIAAGSHTATSEQLELWADRILDAPSLEAVFGSH